MIPHPCSDVLQTGVNLSSRRDCSTLQHRCGPERLLGCHVSGHHPVDRTFPLRMRGTQNFIQDVKVNAKPFNIVFHRGKTKIDEMNVLAVDQNVVCLLYTSPSPRDVP